MDIIGSEVWTRIVEASLRSGADAWKAIDTADIVTRAWRLRHPK